MHSKVKKDEAIKLRKDGNSYAYISSKIAVSKSTLSDWLSGVPFLPNDLTKERMQRSNERLVAAKRVDKAASMKRASDYATEYVKRLSERDMFLFGLGIYLGEGSKTGNLTRIVNSDPRIIRFSMVWLKKCFGLADANFRVRIHLYPDNNENDVVRFWMKELRLKRGSFHPSYVDRRLNKRKDRRGVLPYGTAHLGIVSNGNKDFGVLLQRRIIASIDFALNQYKRD